MADRVADRRPDLRSQWWRKLRVQAKRDLPWVCHRCGLPITEANGNRPDGWTLDHLSAARLVGTARVDLSQVAPAHKRCNSAHGARVSNATRKAPKRLTLVAPDDGYTAPVNGETRPPRFESAPHPAAVGTYGPDAVVMARQLGDTPRPWQQHALGRILEHDERGNLVWLYVALSTPRASGKSWLMRWLAWWRLHQAGRFGEPQNVLHTGKDIQVCRSVMRPAHVAAKGMGDPYTTTAAAGNIAVRINQLDAWEILSQDAVYGHHAGLGLVDEAWAIKTSVVDDGIEPTMLAKRSPQLVLVSTAHSRSTGMMLNRRKDALDQMAAPVDTLLLEWGSDAADLSWDAIRDASPHMDPDRERVIAAKLRRAQAGMVDPDEPDTDPVTAFKVQYLNQWPTVHHAKPVWLDIAGLEDKQPVPSGVVVCAVESDTAGSFAVATGWKDPEGFVHVRVERVGRNLEKAAQYVSAAHPVAVCMHAATRARKHDWDVPVVTVTQVQAVAATEKLRELVTTKVLRWSGPDLQQQLASAAVSPAPGGIILDQRRSRGSIMAAKAAAWVSWAVTTQVGTPAAIL